MTTDTVYRGPYGPVHVVRRVSFRTWARNDLRSLAREMWLEYLEPIRSELVKKGIL